MALKKWVSLGLFHPTYRGYISLIKICIVLYLAILRLWDLLKGWWVHVTRSLKGWKRDLPTFKGYKRVTKFLLSLGIHVWFIYCSYICHTKISPSMDPVKYTVRTWTPWENPVAWLYSHCRHPPFPPNQGLGPTVMHCSTVRCFGATQCNHHLPEGDGRITKGSIQSWHREKKIQPRHVNIWRDKKSKWCIIGIIGIYVFVHLFFLNRGVIYNEAYL